MLTVDQMGCDWNQRDDDNDTVLNSKDACPGTEPEAEVDGFGCSASQRDSDEDGKATPPRAYAIAAEQAASSREGGPASTPTW